MAEPIQNRRFIACVAFQGCAEASFGIHFDYSKEAAKFAKRMACGGDWCVIDKLTQQTVFSSTTEAKQ